MLLMRSDTPACALLADVRVGQPVELQLTPYPHRRRRWMLAGNWSVAAEVNP